MSSSPSLASMMNSPLLSKSDSARDEEAGPYTATPRPSPTLSKSLRKISSYDDLVMEAQLHANQQHYRCAAIQVAISNVYEKIQYLWHQGPPSLEWHLVVALLVWYIVGLGAIVTTKILLTEWNVPPLLLTLQQFIVASQLLKLRLLLSKSGIAPWPWNNESKHQLQSNAASPASLNMNATEISLTNSSSNSMEHTNLSTSDTSTSGSMDFLLTGLFNSLDLLATNVAFATSAASFVETIKSADPITTTAVALIWKVDRLESDEGVCLFVLVTGMLLSTWGNASNEESPSMASSTQAAATVMTANVCFAFRAMSQKLYRRHAEQPMNDENLLAKMFQVGAMALSVPCLIVYASYLSHALEAPRELQLQYAKLAGANAVAFAMYNLASTYVLSRLSVLQHSTLGCLRRMFVAIGACLFFGVQLEFFGIVGLLTSFGGFCGFTFYRAQRMRREEKSAV
ncbi:hypothetical protein MPSEU_000198200 [Mayamaea pseudoterrestris]|nr:hypothetical protein MPSEU_000198200 [Mayamaea pseudoterrestris]